MNSLLHGSTSFIQNLARGTSYCVLVIYVLQFLETQLSSLVGRYNNYEELESYTS